MWGKVCVGRERKNRIVAQYSRVHGSRSYGGEEEQSSGEKENMWAWVNETRGLGGNVWVYGEQGTWDGETREMVCVHLCTCAGGKRIRKVLVVYGGDVGVGVRVWVD